MHFHRFACKIVLKMATEIRKREDVGNPLQVVNSKYRTLDAALAIMSQSKWGNANTFRLNHVREPHFAVWELELSTLVLTDAVSDSIRDFDFHLHAARLHRTNYINRIVFQKQLSMFGKLSYQDYYAAIFALEETSQRLFYHKVTD